MTGKEIFCNYQGWNLWKKRFFLAAGILIPVALVFCVKNYLGTSDVVAQTQQNAAAQQGSRQVGPQQRQPDRRSSQPAAQSNRTITTVAIINGQQITRQQLANECVRRYGNDVIKRMMHKQLVLGETQRRGIVITQKDVDDEVVNVAKKFGIPPDNYLKLLETKKNITADQYKRDVIWPALALRKLAAGQIQISRQEIDTAMEMELGPQIQVLMIALDDARKAQQVHQACVANPESFGRLAKDHSIDANSAAVGGMVPPIRKHAADPKIEQAAFALKEGQVSGIVQVANQYLIMKCQKHYPAPQISADQRKAFEQRIVEQLSERKLGAAATELLKKLQASTRVANVYNDAALSKQYPGVAGMVGNVQITVRQLAEECIVRHGPSVLDGEINRALLNQQLKKNKIEITDADLQAEVARAADAFGMLKTDGNPDVEKWLEYVTQAPNVTVELYVRDAVWPSVALKKLVQDKIQVTKEDLEKGFEANFGERVEALAIVLPDQKSATRVWEMASKNRTAQFFGELAAQYSIEPASQAHMGRVPPIQKYGGRPDLEKVAFQLKPGELSGLVNVGENWIILHCIGRTKPVVQDFNAVKDELTRDIHEKKLRLAMSKRFDEIHSSSQIDNFLICTSQAGRTSANRQRQAEAIQGRLPFKPKR